MLWQVMIRKTGIEFVITKVKEKRILEKGTVMKLGRSERLKWQMETILGSLKP